MNLPSGVPDNERADWKAAQGCQWKRWKEQDAGSRRLLALRVGFLLRACSTMRRFEHDDASERDYSARSLVPPLLRSCPRGTFPDPKQERGP